MNMLRAGWSTALACGLALVGCRDTGTAPRSTAGSPTFAAAADTGGGGGNQSHFVSNGVNGFVNWSSGPDSTNPGGGFVFGELSVSRGGTTGHPQTFLFYFIEQCDEFFNCSFSEGSGLIPNADLSGGLSGTQLHLRTNTTGNTNFFTFGGSTGLIAADWKANGLFTFSSNGTSQQSSPGFTFKTQGSSGSSSANVSGTIVGTPIPLTPNGSIGTNHNVTIDIFH
jgi:hypothetical protein